MNITINSKIIEVLDGETLLETAKRAGFEIPSLCYAKGAVHKSSCMVCAVKNQTNGQIIPSCTTYPAEGMNIETESEEVRKVRVLSLELLLSDHRADCEAPCSMVCPKGLDIEQMLNHYDSGRNDRAYLLISEAFQLPEINCDTCKAPCEKACRRGTVDNAVSIRKIIKEITGMSGQGISGQEKQKHETGKNVYHSRLGRFTTNEKERLRTTITSLSRCLHCPCTGKNDCKLRLYATSEGIKRSRYETYSALHAMHKQHINNNLWFEQAKCIRCGLCVYNSENGFTFKERGFGMQVILPEENRGNIRKELFQTGKLDISSCEAYSQI
jgi:predicted molibdopterin-dependent oxidoreductase YjgC